jgi:hypothetical protein
MALKPSKMYAIWKNIVKCVCTDCNLSMGFATWVTIRLQLLVGVVPSLPIMFYGKYLVLKYEGCDVVRSKRMNNWDRILT